MMGTSLFAQTEQSPPAEALLGLWGSEQTLGPAVRGELVLEVRGTEWQARIAGLKAVAHAKGGEIRFSLLGDKGEFRGRLDPKSKSIYGHWIQPASAVFNNRYASPVQLRPVGKSTWKGDAVPLDERMSFYISIQRAADGSLTAFIRNPEFNIFRRQVFKVEEKNGALLLGGKGVTLEGRYDPRTDRIFFAVFDDLRQVEFIRRQRGDALGLYPRNESSADYIYKKPMANDDGWPTASLADAGLDAKPLAQLVKKIMDANPADNPLNIQSVLIARHGKLVLEEYFYGFNQNREHTMRSAGKTLAPVLLGIARDHGAKVNSSTPVHSLFPEYKPFANWSETKSAMTVRDIMTMTSGLDCDDNKDDSPGNEGNMQSQTAQPDWYKYTLDLPMASQPGGDHAVYCSADLNLVGGVVRNVTGRWLPEFFDQYFARPLQIRNYQINLTPTEDAYMGGGIFLRPRDQLKLGQLYLSGGVWNRKRVVSREWVEESTARHSTFDPNIKDEPVHDYGYGWHERRFIKVGDRIYRNYGAGGNGGQLVIVIPDLDMVVGINGGSYGDFRWYRWELDLLPGYIVPSALPQSAP